MLFMKKIFLVLTIAFIFSGCANHTTTVYTATKPKQVGLEFGDVKVPDGIHQGAGYPIHNHYFLWGWIQKNDVDATKICKGRTIKKIVVEQRWYQSLFQWLTFGIYSPMQTTIYC